MLVPKFKKVLFIYFFFFTYEEQWGTYFVNCRGKEYLSFTVSWNFPAVRQTVVPIALFNPICSVPFAFVFSSVVIFKPIILYSLVCLVLTGFVRHVWHSAHTVVETNSTGPSHLANKASVVCIMIECTRTSVERRHIHTPPSEDVTDVHPSCELFRSPGDSQIKPTGINQGYYNGC